MIKKNLLSAFAICLTLTNAYSQTLKIYVANNGLDNAKGSITSPLNSVEKAILIANDSVEAPGMGFKSVEILIRQGIYPIDKTIEIIQGKTWNSRVPLTIESYQNEKVTLHGGRIVNLQDVEKVQDPEFAKRFQPEVRDKIRQVNLKKLSIHPGKLRPVGFGRADAPSWMEVFFDGKPGTIARWPNDSSILIGKVIDAGSIPRNGDNSNRGAVFTYSGTNRPSRWKESQKVWIDGYFNNGYAEDAVPLKNIDTVNHYISTAVPHIYGFASGKPWRAWYAYNIPEEIDSVGEYYVDEGKRILYFLPPSSRPTIEISTLENPVVGMKGVSNVAINNITFTCSRGMGVYIEKAREVSISNSLFTNLGLMGVCVQSKDLIRDLVYKEKTGQLVKNSYIGNRDTVKTNQNIRIDNCKIYQTGSGGVIVGGGDRLTLEAGNDRVYNCTIHDFNRIQRSYHPGVLILDAGNTISTCDIYNAPSMAILLHGNNHVIEYNNIHDVATKIDDQGALYYGRDPSERGLKVQYNYFHNIGNGLNSNATAIYHDDGACGMEVFGNIFYKTGKWAGFIGGGSDNTYINNIFIDVPFALHIDNRLQNWAKLNLAKGGLFENKLNAVNYQNPPYAVLYPYLVKYLSDSIGIPKRNIFSKNVLIKVTKDVDGNINWINLSNDNILEATETILIKFEGEDIKLIDSNAIRKRIPAFTPIPFTNIAN